MTGKEFITTQITMVELGKQIEKLPFEALEEAILGMRKPIEETTLSPELKERALKNLDALHALASSFIEVKKLSISTRETITRTQLGAFLPPESKTHA